MAPLSPVETPNEPFQHFFSDILGPFQTTKRGHTYVLTCIDAFSKMVELIPLRNITAHTVAEATYCLYVWLFSDNLDRPHDAIYKLFNERIKYSHGIEAHLLDNRISYSCRPSRKNKSISRMNFSKIRKF